jgi:hypothetical protein
MKGRKNMEIKETLLWPTRIWEVENLFDDEFNNNLLEELLLWREEYGPWTGSLPEGLSEQFMISIKTPKDTQLIEFDVHQECENGRVFNYTKTMQQSTKEIMYDTPAKFEVK